MLCKTINLIIICVSFILSYGTDPCLFEVKNVNESLHILQQLNFKEKTHAQLTNWLKQIEENPLYFEDPATNFLFLKFLMIDVEAEMVPTTLKKSVRRLVTSPTEKELKKSAVLLHEMMALYNIPIHQVVVMT